MWNSPSLLVLRVRAGRVRLRLFLAGYAVTGFLTAWEPLARLLPGAWGKEARDWLDTAQAAAWALLGKDSQPFVDVDAETADGPVQVKLYPLKLSGKEREKP